MAKLPALLLAAALIFPIVSGTASAAVIGYHGVEIDIDNRLLTDESHTFIFDEPVSHFDYEIDCHVSQLDSSVSSGDASCSFENLVKGSVIRCYLYEMEPNATKLDLSLKTRGSVRRKDEHYEFRSDLGIGSPTRRLVVLVKLPPTGILAESSSGRSYLPPDGTVLTDGKRIMVSWADEGLVRGENAAFSITFDLPGAGDSLQNFSFAILTVSVVAAMIGTAFYMRRGMKSSDGEVKVLPLLNKSEKTIVDIIARHGGEARQKVLVNESDFSKAKVSRVIKSLEERGVISMEAISGRENKVVLEIKGVPIPRPNDDEGGEGPG